MRVKRLLAFASVLAASLAVPAVIGAQEPAPQPSAAPEAAAGDPAQQHAAGVPAAESAAAAPADQPLTVTTSSISRAEASQGRTAKASQGSSVSVGDYFYSPSSIEVEVGARVTWTNNGDAPEGHTVTGDGFDSGVFKQGESYSHTFSSAGDFAYICTLHPNMKGLVRVGGRSAGETDGGGSESSGGGAQRSGAAGGTAPAFGGNSESAAGSSGRASGDGGSLPATGSGSLLLALYGIVLLELGFAVRLIARDGLPRLGRR